MSKKQTFFSRIAFGLALFLPVFFIIAALGTKFGLWGYEFGLGTLLFMGAPILLGLTALLGLIALIMALLKKPRTGWGKPLFALLLPVGIFAYLANVGEVAGANPIHDVATDVTNPPKFSDATMDTRRAEASNPLPKYDVPLGKLPPWQAAPEAIKSQSHAQFIAKNYTDLTSVPLGENSPEDALKAVKAAMDDMGFDDVVADPESMRVEGVAETFWFGFKDDVVARIADGKIDLRSVSRVGQSDLGANAKRLGELRGKISAGLGE